MANVKYGESRTRTTTRIGDERYIVQHIDFERAAAIARAIARANGWSGGEGPLDYCDAGAAAATYTTEHATLDEACAAARAELAKGRSLFGACIIEHERYEQAHDDLGNDVRGGSWERQRAFEVAMDGECMEVEI